MLSNENPALMGPRRLTLTAYVAPAAARPVSACAHRDCGHRILARASRRARRLAPLGMLRLRRSPVRPLSRAPSRSPPASRCALPPSAPPTCRSAIASSAFAPCFAWLLRLLRRSRRIARRTGAVTRAAAPAERTCTSFGTASRASRRARPCIMLRMNASATAPSPAAQSPRRLPSAGFPGVDSPIENSAQIGFRPARAGGKSHTPRIPMQSSRQAQ